MCFANKDYRCKKHSRPSHDDDKHNEDDGKYDKDDKPKDDDKPGCSRNHFGKCGNDYQDNKHDDKRDDGKEQNGVSTPSTRAKNRRHSSCSLWLYW